MHRKKQRGTNAAARLERLLEERIWALRREYEQQPLPPPPPPPLPPASSSASSSSAAFTAAASANAAVSSTSAVGTLPFDYVGVQLVADIELLAILRSHALSEARGSLQALIAAEEEADNTTGWARSAEWRAPHLLVRQMCKRIDAVQQVELTTPQQHVQYLQHWSQHQLLLPHRPPRSSTTDSSACIELVCFHPQKRSDFGEVHFCNDLVAVLESAHLGQYSSSPATVTYEVSANNNWMATVRNLRRAAHKYAAAANAAAQVGGGGGGGREVVLLVVWPDAAWHLVRSALDCFSGLMFQGGGGSTARSAAAVDVQAVRESKVLGNSRRKQSLLNLAFALFSNRGQGAVCLKTTSTTQDQGGRRNCRLHVAVMRSQRWIAYSWVYSDGQDLGVDCLVVDGDCTGKELMAAIKRRIGTPATTTTTTNNNNDGMVLFPYGFPPGFFANSDDDDDDEDGDDISVFDVEHGSGVDENAQARKELDDLSYLVDIASLPSLGAGEGVVLNCFAKRKSGAGGAGLPLHVECARRLLGMLHGVVPAAALSDADGELRWHGLRKLTGIFLSSESDELRFMMVTDKMQVQEARVEDWITKLPRHYFDTLPVVNANGGSIATSAVAGGGGSEEDVRQRFNALWDVVYSATGAS